MAPRNLQQPYDLMEAFQQGMRPYYDRPVTPMQLLPAPPEEQQPNPLNGIGGILKGLGMMRKRSPNSGGGVPRQMDADELFPQ